MFIPEIASRCASDDSRRSLITAAEMFERSPVITPEAKAPLSPGTTRSIACDSRLRSRLITSAPPTGGCHSTTGLAV